MEGDLPLGGLLRVVVLVFEPPIHFFASCEVSEVINIC